MRVALDRQGGSGDIMVDLGVVTNANPRRFAGARHQALLEVLRSSERFRTAQDIHLELRECGSPVGLTTVYRHLQALADEGILHTLHLPDRQIAYRMCGGRPRHHHLVCTRCGMAVEIEGMQVESWAQQVAAESDFTDVTPRVDVLGLCPECSGSTGCGAR